MPYIKCISIGNSVASCLKYIANPEKLGEKPYITGLNCSENIAIAEQEFRLTYEHFSHKNFYAPLAENGKSPVKAFHIIQSFKAGECDAELAHKIGVEWVQSVFGKKFQAIICTHTDRDHIHNHICLCPYDLNGIKFNSNKRSLARIRSVSDEICRNYSICEMEKATADKNHIPVGVCYGEWKHRKFGTSWKEIIRRKINSLISFSADLDELLQRLEAENYSVKRGKYISVKLPEQQRFVRLKTLGAEYTEENISRRIFERLYAATRGKTVGEIIAETVNKFGFETRKFSFAQSVKDTTTMLGDQLRIINGEGLSSLSDVKNKSAEIENEIRKTQEQLEILLKHFVINRSKIDELKSKLQALEKKRGVYKNVIQTCSDEDYISRLARLARERMTEQENAKLSELQQEKYTVYCPQTVEQLPYKQLSKLPNIADYFQVSEGNWIDVDGEEIADKLEEIYLQNSIPIGSVIVVKGREKAQYFYVNDVGFVRFGDFEKSQIEQQERQLAAKKRGR
ncbi:MAG: relaxase/mobilization nuclease domain-containing protein [Lachnospiraceae bacterium]|nr:relaxase/mobilization nuclease domain-containing protein [Ruminococcus sp.]MCM1276865.1 relaxase/mobilization nuclease domain-containing protein [Lachnospiraceae bacterium]